MKTTFNTPAPKKATGKFVALFVALIIISANSYATIDTTQEEPDYLTWLKEYVTLRTQNKDSALPLMKIKDYYSKLPDTDKGNVNEKMIDLISVYLNGNLKDETMAMIDLYDFLVDKRDTKRPTLYFIKGNIYAERQDTVLLKETIVQIERCNGKQEYLDKLNDFLLQIRRFVPADQGLDGYWVSDVLMTDAWGIGGDIPKYIINATSNDHSTQMTIKSESPFLTKICITTKPLLIEDKTQISQYFFPFTKDSLYVAWSSEKLKNYNANLAGGLRQITGTTAATISGELAQRNKYSKNKAMLGNMLNGIAEAGLNSLIDAIFTPSKKLYILEGKFRKTNDYLLEGSLKYTYSKIKAGEETDACSTTEKEEICLLKWTPESDVIFMDWLGRPLTPYKQSNISIKKQRKKIEKAKRKGEKIDETILPYWKDLANDTNTEYGRAYQARKKANNKKSFGKQWNRKQIEKLREYNMIMTSK